MNRPSSPHIGKSLITKFEQERADYVFRLRVAKWHHYDMPPKDKPKVKKLIRYGTW